MAKNRGAVDFADFFRPSDALMKGQGKKMGKTVAPLVASFRRQD
jgi:hypothetical protein